MWYRNCDNPQALEPYFAAEPVGNPVVLRAVDVNYDAACVVLRVDLPDSPDKLNRRWPGGANTVQVQLQLESLRDFQLSGWSKDPLSGSLLLSRVAEGLHLTFVSPQLNVSIACGSARISNLSAYVDSTRLVPCRLQDCLECPGKQS